MTLLERIEQFLEFRRTGKRPNFEEIEVESFVQAYNQVGRVASKSGSKITVYTERGTTEHWDIYKDHVVKITDYNAKKRGLDKDPHFIMRTGGRLNNY